MASMLYTRTENRGQRIEYENHWIDKRALNRLTAYKQETSTTLLSLRNRLLSKEKDKDHKNNDKGRISGLISPLLFTVQDFFLFMTA